MVRLQSANGSLSDTVTNLRIEISRLQDENNELKERRASTTSGWSDDRSAEVSRSARLSLDDQGRETVGLGLSGGMIGAVQWQKTADFKGGGNKEKSVTVTVMEATATLKRSIS